MTKEDKKFFESVHRLVEWAKANRGKCFSDWSDEVLFFYLAFHAVCGSLYIVRHNDKVKALAVVQPMSLGEIGKPFAYIDRKDGEIGMVWELIGDKSLFNHIFSQFKSKFPKVNRWFGYRVKDGHKPRLVEFNNFRVERFCHV